MRKRYLLAMALVMTGNGLSAQVTASGYTQAGAYQLQPRHALLAGANAGLLPYYQQLTATVYTEKRFLLDDLSLFEAAVVVPVSSGAFSLHAASFGSSWYSQSKMGLAYGRHLGKQLSVGLQFTYSHFHIAGYGNAGSISTGAGLVYRISDQLMAGLQLSHLAGISFRYVKQEPAPKVAAISLGYRPSAIFYVSTTLVKEAGQPVGVQAALQYKLLQKMQVTGGLETTNATYYFGAGYQLRNLQLDAVAHWHPHLGFSPGLMLTFKKEAE